MALEQVVARVIAAMRTPCHLQSCTCPIDGSTGRLSGFAFNVCVCRQFARSRALHLGLLARKSGAMLGGVYPNEYRQRAMQQSTHSFFAPCLAAVRCARISCLLQGVDGFVRLKCEVFLAPSGRASRSAVAHKPDSQPRGLQIHPNSNFGGTLGVAVQRCSGISAKAHPGSVGRCFDASYSAGTPRESGRGGWPMTQEPNYQHRQEKARCCCR